MVVNLIISPDVGARAREGRGRGDALVRVEGAAAHHHEGHLRGQVPAH